MGTAPARGVMVLLAALVAAWLAVSYDGVQQIETGQALAEAHQLGTLSTARMDAAVDDLDLGRRFSADNAYLITEGTLRMAALHRREATELAREATEREPDNIDAWLFAYAVSRGEDHRAWQEIVRLNPWVAGIR